MHKLFITLTFLSTIGMAGCKDDETPDPTGGAPNDSELYFPPIGGDSWETSSAHALGWDTSKIADLIQFVDESDTRAFLVLKDGKIVLEHYNGKDLLNIGDFGKNTQWYWASAGKTLTSFLVGQAQEDKYLNISDKTSDYLGKWTELTQEQEDKITVRHQLTMSSGLDDGSDADCTEKQCLTYKADAGARWAYHNAPYTLLDSVIQQASQQDFDDYFNNRLRDPIGMNGNWTYLGYNHVYFSTARSMARFGLLVLNNGKWDTQTILGDQTYLEQMVNTSQDINLSYGYLWWLNGKSSHLLPGLQLKINRPITASAPSDMFAAMGKNGQLLNIVPSQNLIVIRMGDNPDNSLVPTSFQENLWKKLNEVIR